MSDVTRLFLGGVYQSDLSEKLIRIIAFDKLQVFYDVWWFDSQNWSSRQSLSNKVIFYRTVPQRIINGSQLIRKELISDEEMAIYRSDLPFFISRNNEIAWSNAKYPSLELFKDKLSKTGVDLHELGILQIAEIVLIPFGPNNTFKKGIAVKALNGNYFTGVELLWQAHNLQAEYINKTVEKGVGIHRLGFEKRKPSYYIGGFYDSGGSLKNETLNKNE